MTFAGNHQEGDTSSDCGPTAQALDLLPLLKSVSRAFYLSIRVLPSRIRQPVALAYVLARAADTIADTDSLPHEGRLGHLIAFRKLLTSRCGGKSRFDDVLSAAQLQPAGPERDLLNAVPAVIDELSGMRPQDRTLVASTVVKLTEGMELDLTHFPPAGTGEIRALATSHDLDRYTYLVAGCVGEFWTVVTMAYTPALSGWNREGMTALGVRLGKALQMTNILRDLPGDLAAGRCYLPTEWLEDVGMSPQDLSNPRNYTRARGVLVRGTLTALEHFSEAEAYVTAIPRRCVRLRLAAMWPLLMGLATLDRVVRASNPFGPHGTSKVSRAWVYRMIVLSLLFGHSNHAVSIWAKHLTQGVRRGLKSV